MLDSPLEPLRQLLEVDTLLDADAKAVVTNLCLDLARQQVDVVAVGVVEGPVGRATVLGDLHQPDFIHDLFVGFYGTLNGLSFTLVMSLELRLIAFTQH